MKLRYTDVSHDMTELLVKEASSYANKGFRVFYIAPNSLSFEKERAVLEYLPQEASFAITVTRFAQMARYLTLKQEKQKENLSETALALVFYRAMKTLEPGQLKVFDRLQTDPAFIQQLVDLYKELQTANLSVYELSALESSEKQADFITIFEVVDAIMAEQSFETASPLATLLRAVKSGDLDEQLKKQYLLLMAFHDFQLKKKNS